MKIDFLKNCVNFISTPVISKNERIVHPLAVKVTAIALAILTCGLFVIASICYTLYQQRQAKQLDVIVIAEDEEDDDIDDFEVIVISDPSKLEKPDVDEKKLEEKIYAFVQRFLHPYITGEITEANDDPNRKPLINLLKEEFKDAEINEETGLNAYLEVAAMGLYVNRVHVTKDLSFKPGDPEFKMLKEAVVKALPKDFPDLKMTEDTLVQKIADALEITNKRRDEANNDPIILTDPNAVGSRLMKFNSLRALNCNGELFLNN